MRLVSRRTPAYRDATGRPIDSSVAFLGRPELGGIPQGVLARGRHRDRPALLVLHGGPGGAYIGCARHWFGFLEEEWVVVNWDLRGAGLSYSRKVPPKSLTAGQIEDDARQLIAWILRELHPARVVLLAHSFGTLVAPHVLRAGPGTFELYVAVSPAPIDPEAELESYGWTLAQARARNNPSAVRELERIGAPPYRPDAAGLSVRARWTDRLGGAQEGTTGADLAFRALRSGTEYSWWDLFFRLLPGVRFWMRHVDESLSPSAYFDSVPEYQVPVTVIQGTRDWMSPAPASKRMFERLKAPGKSYVELDGLGHYPFVEAPERFARALDSAPP